jgi:hypothetical protein
MTSDELLSTLKDLRDPSSGRSLGEVAMVKGV